MTIANAKAFIRRGMKDSGLRARLNAAPSLQVRDEILAEEDLLFSTADFEEACRNQLTECQTQGAADALNEFKLWWDLLTSLVNPVACETGCRGCRG